MNEIGPLLKMAREANGVSIEEASEDLNIKIVVLENIEDGNIGCFKDIYALRNHLRDYSKYLGLDPEKIENDFNDFMFEYTSKISKKKLEKAINQKKRLEKKDERIVSPYTKIKEKDNTLFLYLIYSFGTVILFIIIFILIKMLVFS